MQYGPRRVQLFDITGLQLYYYGMADVGKHLKSKFFAGLFILIPLLITIYVIYLIVSFFEGYMGPIIRNILYHLAGRELYVAGSGFVLFIIVTYLTGVLTSNYIGKKLLEKAEKLLKKVPVIKVIYGSVKDMTDAFSSDKIKSFQEVVLVEFPSKGQYAVGFVTKRTEIDGKTLCSVFVPLTPNPTASILLLIKEENLTFLDVSTDDAMKYVISLGTTRIESPWKAKK